MTIDQLFTECQYVIYENDLHIVTDHKNINKICNSTHVKGVLYDSIRCKFDVTNIMNYFERCILLTTSRSERRSVIEDGSNDSALSSSRTSTSMFLLYRTIPR